ncbi:hypothetical protein ILUMI_13907 [Ignelater luminosus]|uniref:Uncharacterized protein n=1 Tax=Ignelater luminosus TaxID=2038154 RepID=A0A8K0CVA0_IGNLU|nr:hypothetical protein ILUMI_13907 [Ignelater luminosus]
MQSKQNRHLDREEQNDYDDQCNVFSEHESSDEYIPTKDEMSETDYSGESDSDIVLPPEKATAAHHVTAENLQEDVPAKHTIVLEKKKKLRKKYLSLKKRSLEKRGENPKHGKEIKLL